MLASQSIDTLGVSTRKQKISLPLQVHDRRDAAARGDERPPPGALRGDRPG